MDQLTRGLNALENAVPTHAPAPGPVSGQPASRSPGEDGRRLRSAESRRRIIEAVLLLIQEGRPEPGAEAVAARAGVGLRTVFRLFSDMESLCAEMLQPQRMEFVQCFLRPFDVPYGAPRLRELFLRLSALYEARLPLRRAAMIRRYSSPSLAGAMQELDTTIADFVADEIAGHGERQRIMVNLLMSYEAWIRLRDGQGLTAEQTRATLVHAIDQQLEEGAA
jgi:AcrR family transcriptional regulator